MKQPGAYPSELLKDIARGSGTASVAAPGLHTQHGNLLPAMFFDDCSGTLAYQTCGTGVGWQVAYLDSAAYVGLFGLKVETKADTPVEYDYARAELQMHAHELGILRFQMLLCRAPETSADFITTIAVFPDDGVQGYLAEIQIDWATPAFSFLKKVNAGFAMTPVPGWLPNYKDNGWNHVQLAVNVAAGHYLELLLNGKRLSIPTEPLGLAPTEPWAPFVKMWLQTRAVAEAQASTYFDQILVTAERAR